MNSADMHFQDSQERMHKPCSAVMLRLREEMTKKRSCHNISPLSVTQHKRPKTKITSHPSVFTFQLCATKFVGCNV